MTNKQFRKIIESETQNEMKQHYRCADHDDDKMICENCKNMEYTLSSYSSGHRVCAIGGFVISGKMTCDHFAKNENKNNAEQK